MEALPALQQLTLSIILEFLPSEEKEMIPELQLTLTKTNEINLFNLLLQLKQMGFLVENCMISYWSSSSEMYVFCGYDPVPKYIAIPLEDFFPERKLTLKVKQINRSLLHILMSDDIQKQEIQNDDPGDDVSEMEDITKEKNKTQNDQSQIKCRRTKERKIGFIIEKVSHWRRYYTGDLKDEGKECRLSLEDAAKKVQISKKSLDDYLLQIRLGRKFGFNFNEHYNDKVGVLRAFVKKNKQLATKQSSKKKK